MFLLRMFLIPYVLTVVVEEIAALIWGYYKPRDLLTVLWVNTITNPAVTGLRYLSNQFLCTEGARTAVIIVLEVAVLLVEWRLFQRFLSKGRHFFWLSLTLNAASYGSGFLLPVIMQLLR